MTGPRGFTGRKAPTTDGKCLACEKPAPKHSYCGSCRTRLRKGYQCLEFTEDFTPTRHEMRQAKSSGTAREWGPLTPWETER